MKLELTVFFQLIALGLSLSLNRVETDLGVHERHFVRFPMFYNHTVFDTRRPFSRERYLEATDRDLIMLWQGVGADV